MTHDELLAKINVLEETIHKELGNTLILGSATPFDALRAVVELAATYKDGNYVNEEFNQGLQTAFQLIIEAIEKELA
jgi:hypothetical protein